MCEDEEDAANFYALSDLHDWVDEIINDRLAPGMKNQNRAWSILEKINSFDFDERFRYSENVCLFFEIYRSYILNLEKISKGAFAENLKNLIELIRLAANQKFRARVASRKRSAVNNRHGARELIDRLFVTYGQLHVIRLDLLIEYGGAHLVSVEQAHARLKCFFGDRRRDKIHQELVGYIWKLEYSPRKGVYFHVVLILHTEVPRENGELVKRFGEYWHFVVTGMKGGYICNDEKWEPLRFGGTGEISPDNQEKRKALIRGIDYIVYKDVFLQPVRFVIDGRKKMRTFGKSN